MKTEFMPSARIKDLKTRKEADKMAYFSQDAFDYRVITFPSRKVLENCLKKGTGQAVIKTLVSKNCVLYPGFEYEIEAEGR